MKSCYKFDISENVCCNVQIPLTKEASIGACVSPIFTPEFDVLYAWLNHYTKLGVEAFHVYWTNNFVNWTHPFDDTPDGVHQFHPFHHPVVKWYQYDELHRLETLYHDQRTLMNECIFRNRHAYDFLVMFDFDEFLVIKEHKFPGVQGHVTLLKILNHMLPPDTAALGLYRYAYRRDCEGNVGHSEGSKFELEEYNHRTKTAESMIAFDSAWGNRHDKLIVRPKLIENFGIHNTDAISGVMAETAVLPSSMFLKHLRHRGQDCAELVTDDPE